MLVREAATVIPFRRNPCVAAVAQNQRRGVAAGRIDGDQIPSRPAITLLMLGAGRPLRAAPPQPRAEDEPVRYRAGRAGQRRPRSGRQTCFAAGRAMTRLAEPRLAPPTAGQVCAMFAVDMAEFTRRDRDDDHRMFMREELYRILERAFDGSGIPWAACVPEDRGDGVLVVVSPGIGATGIIDPLPDRLRSLIRRHNHVSSPAARIQLRAAAHLGPVHHDGHGFVGTDVDFLFRMLDARPLKHTLASAGADLALIVSDYVYRNIVSRHPSLVSPAAFRRVRFQVKHTRAWAWTYVPSALPSSSAKAAPLVPPDDVPKGSTLPRSAVHRAQSPSGSLT
jgi:hypothetical protein